jgi:enamine deaminase RidA (YjgF/YER057c/UK114 family)
MPQRANPSVVPAPAGAYTHVTTVPAGTDLVFVSGQVAAYADGRPAPPDAAEQTRQTLANLGALVTHLGVTPAAIAKLTTFVVGPENLAGFRTGRTDVFAEWYPDGDFPAHTLVVVAGLASPEILVEIEAVVAVPHP